MNSFSLYCDFIPVPRAIRWPVELEPPEGFSPERLETWPEIDGCLEYVDGRLLYMPPTGADQSETVVDIVGILWQWQQQHPAFVVRTSEAGMILAGSIRAADAAIWRRADLDSSDRGLARVPPILAVEVAGRDEKRTYLPEKAHWYLRMGVAVVWLVHPAQREVRVLSANREDIFRSGDILSAHDSLPDLAPAVDSFFTQLSG